MKKKSSSGFVCITCGYKSPIKLGKCPQCESWNSFVEVEESVSESKEGINSLGADSVVVQGQRIVTKISEFDRVLGGGIVEGSVILIGGEPGIGKSTLLLQIADAVAKATSKKTLYVSGEESYIQIRMRAERLGIRNENILIYTEQNMDSIRSVIAKERPGFVIIDSIQTISLNSVEGSAGNVAQVKECTRSLTEIAKKSGIPVVLVGHVTKEGTIAGPKTIEHVVDGVFYIEGSRNDVIRVLRSAKNRFGTTNEAGIFEMREDGLVEVKNPLVEFIAENEKLPPGTAITASLEGSLPFFFEVQALATPTVFPLPRRVASGIEYNRLLLIVAILEKSLKIKFGSFDVYASIVGGFRTEDRSMDLALAMAILSSYFEKPIPLKTVIIGEPGLAGEIRPTIGTERKVIYGLRLGFENFLVPAFLKDKIKTSGANILFASNISEAKELIF